jgi:hypothetical protein
LATLPENRYRHSYALNDVVMWDVRRTLLTSLSLHFCFLSGSVAAEPLRVALCREGLRLRPSERAPRRPPHELV